MTETSETISDNLLTAANHKSEKIERRKKSIRVKSERRKSSRLSVGLDVSPSGISIAYIATNTGADSLPALTTDFVAFDKSSGPYNGDWSTDELTQHLVKLVEKHRLSGHAVCVALGGEPCVTRAWFGKNADVDANISELRERTHRYLSLGRGDKISSYSEQQIDAKRKRAWLTVAHREVVNAIANAIKASGMRLTRIEHTLTTLCSAIGSTGYDAEEPVLLLNTSFGRPELGISFGGQLLLDYRPAAIGIEDIADANGIAAQMIGKHIKCVRRYLQPQLPRGTQELRKVCLPGRATLDVDSAKQLAQEHGLEIVDVMPVSTVCDGLSVESPPAELSSVLSAVWLARDLQAVERQNTDLMQSLRKASNISLASTVKTLWPIAASIMLVIGLNALTFIQSHKLNKEQRQLESLQPARIEYQRAMHQLAEADERLLHTNALLRNLPHSNWNEIVKFSGRALPQGTWLRSVLVRSDSTVEITGASFTNDAIFDYLQRLKSSQLFTHVTLGGTRTVHHASGPAFEFEITTTAFSGKLASPESVAANLRSRRL